MKIISITWFPVHRCEHSELYSYVMYKNGHTCTLLLCVTLHAFYYIINADLESNMF